MVPLANARADMGRFTEYGAKRQKGATNEPFGPEPPLSARETRAGAFVVHLHAARRLHHDLRLEVSGALKSFAVPKGPSLAPDDRRLAVETEDHPIGYLDFEAVIPEGSYGAGAMIVWDRGRVRYLETTAEEGVARGKLHFELEGHKLRGRFELVRTGEKKWLLFKKPDEHARAVELDARSILSGLLFSELAQAPAIARQVEAAADEQGAEVRAFRADAIVPMLCAADDTRLDEAGHLYELKLDGFRILAEKAGQDVALYYRSMRQASSDYPDVVRAVRALPGSRLVLDGEIVAFDARGRPSFSLLSSRLHGAGGQPVSYVVFDLLAVGDRDTRPLPLRVRKELLGRLVRGRGIVRVLDHIEDDGRPLYAFCQQERLEGLVKKRADSPYRAGPRRSRDWVKVKCLRDEDFVVVGVTGGEGGRARLGALDLATYDGERLVVRGKVGSGLDDRSIDALLERTRPLGAAGPTAEGRLEPAARGRTFLRPGVVVRVRFSGWTDDGRLRHPVFVGIAPDKSPADCTARPPGSDVPPVAVADAKPAASRGLAPTHPDKVFWPEEGITKNDLFRYYEAIAPVLLPYLAERPIVLVRYPDGIAKEHFYQWNVPRGTPSWVRTCELSKGDAGGTRATAFLVDDADTLLYIVNLGAIPIHVLARRATHSACDFLTFDFDLGKGPVGPLIDMALGLRALLEDAGLVGFSKTSGQSGLHVLVPLGPGISFATARAMVALLGRILEGRYAQTATMERRVADRGGKVYIDTGQTGPSRTIVSPYSVRAHPGATVSTPVFWDELDPRRPLPSFSMADVLARVRDRGDPMRDLMVAKADVPAAVAALGQLVRVPSGPPGGRASAERLTARGPRQP
jgi:bifunctional non-homologous end joining protein LigD